MIAMYGLKMGWLRSLYYLFLCQDTNYDDTESDSDVESYARPSWANKKTPLKLPKKATAKEKEETLPSVSEMVLESIKALKDEQKYGIQDTLVFVFFLISTIVALDLEQLSDSSRRPLLSTGPSTWTNTTTRLKPSSSRQWQKVTSFKLLAKALAVDLRCLELRFLHKKEPKRRRRSQSPSRESGKGRQLNPRIRRFV